MYYNPVFWSDNYQLSGDTVRFTMLDSIHSKIELCKAGFIVGGLFKDTEFNQIKGLNIVGHLEHQNLQRVDIVGNAECVYYIQEEDSSLVGINTSITSEMRIFLDSNHIRQIRYYDAPNGQVHRREIGGQGPQTPGFPLARCLPRPQTRRAFCDAHTEGG